MRIASPPIASRLDGNAAYTLPEMIITMGIFLLAITGVISASIMGGKLYQVTGAKLDAAGAARKAMDKIVSDIRESDDVAVGAGNATTFTEAAINTIQQGNAAQITQSYPAVQTVTYWLDTNAGTLFRRTTLSATRETVANYVTNTIPFTLESATNTVLTNSQAAETVGFKLMFFRPIYPYTPTGPGRLYDSAQIQVRVTPRVLQ
jgi:hypothetical protein